MYESLRKESDLQVKTLKEELKDRSEHIEVLWNSEANLRHKLDKIKAMSHKLQSAELEEILRE